MQLSDPKDKPSTAIFFPVYRDEATVETVVKKTLKVLSDIASRYKVVYDLN